jgi:hypothetical protein
MTVLWMPRCQEFLQKKFASASFKRPRFPHAKSTFPLIGEASYLRLFYRLSTACVRRFNRSAQQGARANADICHAACNLMYFGLKRRSPDRDEARGAPDAVVAHL